MATTVVFDIGGVLVPEGNRMEQLQETVRQVLGPFDSSAFGEAYWEYRDDYDLGATEAEFWIPVLKRAGIESFGNEEIAAVADRDSELNTGISEASEQLLEVLEDHRVQLGILSNAPLGMAKAVRKREWAQRFSSLTFSSEHGLKKPDPKIYQLVMRDLGVDVEPHDLVFFDDRKQNVAAAEQAGWAAHQWESVEDARAFLRSLGVL